MAWSPNLPEFYSEPLGLVLILVPYEAGGGRAFIPEELNGFIGLTLDGWLGNDGVILDIVFFE
jgi:hypothetical protein